MRNPFLAGCIVGSIFIAAAPAVRAANGALSLQLGTTGLSLHAVAPINAQMNGRIGVNYFSHYDFTTSTRYVDWDMRLQMRTFDLLLDWYPRMGNFRITSGLMINHNEIEARGAYGRSDGLVVRGFPFSSFTYQGVSYKLTQIGALKGRVTFPSVSPYLGIGWGNALDDQKGWGFSGDLGVLFQGSPTSRVTTADCTLPGRSCEVVGILLAAENERLTDKLKRFRAYPVLRAGINYRF